MAIQIEYDQHGWGLYMCRNTKRPYAVRIGGELLRNESGAVRTFASEPAAWRAAQASLENGAPFDPNWAATPEAPF